MNKNIIKTVLFIIVGIILYKSFYIRDLSEMKEEQRMSQFNINTYVEDFWSNKLLANLDKANDEKFIINLLKNDMQKAIEYSNTLGVASVHSYMIKGIGKITAINEESFIVLTENGNKIEIATDYIFSNSVRDASGFIDVSDFPNTMEFNNISELINEKIVTHVISPIIAKLQINKSIKFVGASEISEINPVLNPLKLIPIKLEIISNE